MTTKVKEEKKVAEDKKEEEKFKPADYSCEILLEKTTLEKSNDRSFPTDAFNITYEIDGEEYLDVARSSKRVNIFDLYHDKYGKVKKIDYGFGSIAPNMWGNKPAERKKRKRKV